ncbi:AAA family ATPase [uncultured Desulfosarcina sp.]|uniref:bifunctional aminoglycoside phosphotransferase/ATP-binding protein n=1 Tax=uncultured Desulfosarcina sp. TaxID=218289 RepID=UPI0029C6403A|nr:AAA family ATPase [uncultured Desulfosarcina sp.]
MTTHHQAAILEAMMHPGFYPHPAPSIRRQETHISTVFLTGAWVYKIKKSVNLGFLDFSTLDKRRRYCRQEVALNRRLAAGIYIGVVPITCQEDGYGLNGPGETVEFAVKMRQLDESDVMVDRLRRGVLTDRHIELLVNRLVDFYTHTADDCEIDPKKSPAWEMNLQEASRFAGVWIDRRSFDFVRTATQSFVRTRGSLFRRRLESRKIKDGHGDLRTDHIYFTADGIQVIDCIEFNPHLRCLDIVSDLAFLAMDLAFLGFADQGRDLIRLYARQADDLEALPLLDFYRCYRAMVRCKVSCLRLEEGRLADIAQKALVQTAGRYLALARGYAEAFSRPMMWMVGGLPASGKSTIAKALSKIHDICVIRSDAVRKAHFSDGAKKSGTTAFEEGIYSAGATEATYDQMAAMAAEKLKKGCSVVLDATFSRQAHRNQALRMARYHQATPIFVECHAGKALLSERLKRRETEPSLSDARLIHLEAFKKRFEPVEAIGGAAHLRVDTARPIRECLHRILLSDALLAGAEKWKQPRQRATAK